MRIGAPADGLSLLLVVAFGVTVWLAMSVARGLRRAPASAGTFFAAVAAAYPVYLGAAVVGTELLSAFHALRRGELVAWWSAYVVVAATLAWWFQPAARRRRGAGAGRRWARPATASVAAVAFVGALSAYLFWLGVTAAPDTPDSMSYHLVRVANWATRATVANYPTYVPLQLYYGRLDEYLVTHALVLDGTDRLVFLPQWMAYVVTVALVAGVARLLGSPGRRRAGAVWGALLAATTPLAVMQASTTSNDLFAASVVLSCFFLCALVWRVRRPDPLLLALAGLAAGLAFATKTDAALALLPLPAAMLVMAWRDRWPLGPAARGLALALAVAVAASLPMTARNEATFHDVLGQTSSEGLTVSTAAPGPLLGNAVRNLLDNVDTLRPGLDAAIDRWVVRAGRPLGLDAPSPATSYTPWPAPGPTPSPAGSGSLVAMVAILAGAGLLLSATVRRRLSTHEFYPLAAAALGGFCLLVVVLKWQSVGARFQLMAVLPLVACAAAAVGAAGRRWGLAVGGVLVAASLVLLPFALVQDVDSPVVGAGTANLGNLSRDQEMLRWCPSALPLYEAAVDRVSAPAAGRSTNRPPVELGYVATNLVGSIYPLWALLSQKAGGAPVAVVPVGVDNATGQVPPAHPPAVIRLPAVTLVMGPSAAAVEHEAAPLLPLGYRLQSVTPTQCEVLGTAVLGPRRPGDGARQAPPG